MTDANIAAELLVNAFDDRFETALPIAADSDLTRPVEIVRHQFPNKRVVIAFPRDRYLATLERVANDRANIAIPGPAQWPCENRQGR